LAEQGVDFTDVDGECWQWRLAADFQAIRSRTALGARLWRAFRAV